MEKKLKSITNDLSYYELIENAKKHLKNDNISLAHHYINLLLSYSKLDQIFKLNSLHILSQICYKRKDFNTILYLSKNIISYIKEIKIRYDIESINLITETIAYIALTFLDDQKALLSSYFFYELKNIIDEYKLNLDEKLAQIIEEGYTNSINSISKQLETVKSIIILKKKELSQIFDYFRNYDKKIYSTDRVYLICSYWVTNMIAFIKNLLENYNDDKEYLDNIFFLNNVCILYFNEDNEYKDDLMGSYPGPVNNFILIDNHDSWIDYEEKNLNYTLNKVSEKLDYYIVTEEIYNIIKNIFGVYYEIERNVDFDINSDLIKLNVIFVSEMMRTIHPEIKFKYLQMLKISNLKDLEKKSTSIFKHLIQKENHEFDLKIFKYENLNEVDIVNLILSFVNKDKNFKIHVKEIKKEKKSLTEMGINNNDMLIIEFFPKNSIIKPFIRVFSESFNCSNCNLKIENIKINCDNCTQMIYCSDNCKNSDIQHQEYHKKTTSLFKKTYTLEELKTTSILEFTDNKLKGLVGLKNMGNSCFMNTAIQCLSHCQLLTKYFLSKMFYDDINKKSKSGSGGIIIKAFYSMIIEIWHGTNDIIIPWEFKNILSAFAKQLFGMEQNDSHEMLVFLLEKLHDDLNKAGCDINISSDNIEEDHGTIAWRNFTQKENSIIIDLFYGMIRSTIRCPDCKSMSISYEAYNSLGLIIPDKNNYNKIRFRVFPNNNDYNYFHVDIANINKFTSILELKNKIKENPENMNLEYNALLLKNKDFDKVLNNDELIYDYIYTRIDFSDENFIDYEIIFVEVIQGNNMKNKGDYVTFYVKPCSIEEKSNYLIFKYKEIEPLTVVKPFSISKKSTLNDLYSEIFKYYKIIFNDLEMINLKSQDETINTENTSDYDLSLNKYNNMFDLYIVNNIPSYNSYIFKDPPCEFCNVSKCNLCKIRLDLNTTIHSIYVMQKYQRDFVLVADFSKFKNKFDRFYKEFYDPKDPRYYLKGDYTIFDCLEYFRREEKLDKNNMWNCPKCNKNKEAFKKVEIYSLPYYLIIQFKRFKYRGHTSLIEMINNKKNESYIDFPYENFEMGRYIIGNDKNASYRLISVSNHIGNMKQGYNTNFCLNNSEWYEFKDEIINKYEGNLSSENSYYLIYEKVR